MTCRNGVRADDDRPTNRFNSGPFDKGLYLQTLPSSQDDAVPINDANIQAPPGMWITCIVAVVLFALYLFVW